jgi:hypothetical protein
MGGGDRVSMEYRGMGDVVGHEGVRRERKRGRGCEEATMDVQGRCSGGNQGKEGGSKGEGEEGWRGRRRGGEGEIKKRGRYVTL